MWNLSGRTRLLQLNVNKRIALSMPEKLINIRSMIAPVPKPIRSHPARVQFLARSLLCIDEEEISKVEGTIQLGLRS